VNLTIVSTAATGATVGEASQKPMTALTLAAATQLAPKKTTAIVAISAEVAERADLGAMALVGNELRTAVALATDAEFLSVASAAGIASQASAGSTLVNIASDLSFLAGGVGTGQRSKLYLVTTPALAKALSFKSDTVGARAYPEMGPLGGQIANIPVLISDAV